MSKKLTEEEFPAPIGDFILANAKGMQLFDGQYYHYSEVCALLKLFGERVLEKAAENAKVSYDPRKSSPYFVNKTSINNSKNLDV